METQKLCSLTEESMTQFLNKMVEPISESGIFRKYEYRKFYLLKEQNLYSNLNEMEFFNNFLQGSIYVRIQDIQTLQNTLTQL